MDKLRKPSILIVEDSNEHAQLVCVSLGSSYHTVIASSLAAATEAINQHTFDMVLLDLNLPDGDGTQFCASLRDHPDTQNIPVLILSANQDINSKVAGFSVGADDYITKPCAPAELRARVESRLKRKPTTEGIAFRGMYFNFLKQVVSVELDSELKEVNLTPREFKLLTYLAKNVNQIMSREQILKTVWGEKVFVSDRSIDTHIASIRKKLGVYAQTIESIHGTGYRFAGEAINPGRKSA